MVKDFLLEKNIVSKILDIRKPLELLVKLSGSTNVGENLPSIDVAKKIADALGITLDYLVKDG